ncbi:hypothetical protein [Alicyclobacillus sp. SO9]|uniref:hypothetical protein n=1 Tax=Alicyclobacillus sp. SO9 TaxID=2665646 RepID=UPI0018E7ED17|nr:hypothetical protein [Alicyclobacillus sp. SO9]QQE81016.1 hypothetical protein GI364_11925 [Alicyclobacillus sp. SO9]
MCSRTQCLHYVGQYVSFRSPHGYHEGVIERISGNRAVVLSPQRYIPMGLATDVSLDDGEERRLDAVLTWGGYGGYGGRGGAYGYGWGRWAVSFLVIYALLGLWW